MRIGFIAMSGVRVVNPELRKLGLTLPGFIKRGKVIASLPSLGLLTVAGLTPPGHELTYLEVDELSEMEALPDFDLVAISSLTARIEDAYALATRFREGRIPVVMGGLHVSVLPDEASKHCNSVITGGAEGIWSQVLADAEAGQLKPRYEGKTSRIFAEQDAPLPAYHLIADRKYNRVTVQTSRGCPRDCEFCGASRMISKWSQKPVDRVMAEIRAAREYMDQPFFELADDNTFLDRGWSREFLTQLIDEEIHWFTESDVTLAEDPELCDLLAQSGCRQVLIGFESPRSTDLANIDPRRWKQQMADRYRPAIDTLQSRGVSVNGCFILGLDQQTTDIFPAVREFVRDSGLAEVQCTVMTPFPGTELYTRLHREGRLLQERFWDRCTLFDVNYRPTHMFVDELEAGMRWLFTELYSQEETSHRKRAFLKAKRQTA